MPINRILTQIGTWKRQATGDSLRGRYARSAFWSMAGSASSQLLLLLSAVVVGRLLGPERYGDLGIIQRTTAAFGTFAGIGLGTTVNRYLAELRVTDPERAGRVWGLIDNVALCTSGVIGTIVIIVAPYLCTHALKAPYLSSLFFISVIALVFNTLMGVQNAALAGFEAFKKTAIVMLVRGVINLPAMVLATYYLGLTGAVIGVSVTAFAGFGVGRGVLRSEARKHSVRFRRKGVWRERSIIWNFSLPMFLSGSILISGEWLCEALLFRQVDGDFQMGLYMAAAAWARGIEFLQNTLARPGVSLMANVYWTDSLVRFRKLCLANVGLIAVAAGGIATGVALLAPWIMAAFGSEYEAGVRVLQLVCAMAAARAVSRATSNVLFAVNRVRVEWFCSMVRITVQLVLWILLSSQGAQGLALAMLGAFVAQLMLQSVYVLTIIRQPSTD